MRALRVISPATTMASTEHASLLVLLLSLTAASALSTDGRWIVDESSGGRRVKLACANWPSHLQPMLAEGLSKQPVKKIAESVRAMGFNCVRFTWPTFLFTDDTLANLTVSQSLESLGLNGDVALIHLHNPTLVDLSLRDAYKSVVTQIGESKIMVILDNHISKPGWCCSNNDGNGFFGDTYFDPEEWKKGLRTVATLFSEAPYVIGISLRNELRGPKQNVNDWFRYMQEGAEVVHAAGEDFLVILSGLSFDNDLAFLASRQVNVSFDRKLVFEVHWYAFSDGDAWVDGNPNDVCGRITGDVMRRAGFLLDQPHPLFLSEFGLDQRGGNPNDNRYFSCALAFAADKDLDWALWALQGSYYLREGVVGMEEFYGALSFDWSSPRNETVLRRIQFIQQQFRGPGVGEPDESITYGFLFHPQTGLCAGADKARRLVLSPCTKSWLWKNSLNTLSVVIDDRSHCVNPQGGGQQATLAPCCLGSDTWDFISASGMHVSTHLAGDNTTAYCWDVGADGVAVVMNPCSCLGGEDASCDPERQWFKMVASNTVTI